MSRSSSATRAGRFARSPSQKISELVSRFESATAPSADSQRQEGILLESPASTVSCVPNRSSLTSGQVERNIRQFSTPARGQTVEESSRARFSTTGTPDVASGSVAGMDWMPRSPPPVTCSSSLWTPPPPAAAKFLPPRPRRTDANSEIKKVASQREEDPSMAHATIVRTDSRVKTQLQASISPQQETTPETVKAKRREKRDGGQDLDRRVSKESSPGTLAPICARTGSTNDSATTSEVVTTPRLRPDGTRDDSTPALPLERLLLRQSTELVGSPLPRDVPDHQLSSTQTPVPCATERLRTPSDTEAQSRPAHEIFARDAAPLHLPHLDALLETHFSSPQFSHLSTGSRQLRCSEPSTPSKRPGRKREAAEKPAAEEEQQSWHEWVRGRPPTLWKRLISPLGATPLLDEHAQRLFDDGPAALTEEQRVRSLIFPPFHRLPPNATLSDLKKNIRKPPRLLSGSSLLQMAADGILNLFGSAAGIRLTTIEGLRDLMQMITMLSASASTSLSRPSISTPVPPGTVVGSSSLGSLLVTIPSALSLDFASTFGHAVLFLLVLTIFAFVALYEFYRFTGGWRGPSTGGSSHVDLGEGFDRQDMHVRGTKFRDRRGWKIGITFALTSLYLPLAKLSLSALVWDRGYWPSQLFGTGRQNDRCFNTVPSGGQGLNSAIFVLPVAILILLFLACWFPIRMYRVVQGAKPSVDKWTELGELRRDNQGEYERLLDKDPSPYSFLYREYRPGWAAFRSVYMAVKLCNTFIVVLLSSENCVFYRFDETKLDVIRQGTLFAFMTAFFLLDVYSRPQLDAISNRSDRISRLAYVGVSLCGMLVALSVPGSDFWDGTAIVLINALSYTFNLYFALIGTQLFRRFVKRAQKRLDFSIDVFSPQLDLSKHINRRIWQETISVLFLTAPAFAMNPSVRLEYCGSPPYLINFHGSVAERHAENLKILREIGLDAYYDASVPVNGSEDQRMAALRQTLQDRVAGPDAYYRPTNSSVPPSITTFFGRLDIVPFPFVAVFRYDQDPSQVLRLSTFEELGLIVQQQESALVKAARKVRLAIRALEGQLVYAPRTEEEGLDEHNGVNITRQVTYEYARVKISRNSPFTWQGYNHSSGFEVSLEYKDGIGIGRNGQTLTNLELVLPGNRCGILSDFSLSKPLAILLRDNRVIVDRQLPLVEALLQSHRRHFAQEAESKRRTLSYKFLVSVFAETSFTVGDLEGRLKKQELNTKVGELVNDYRLTCEALDARMQTVTSSRVRAWWYTVFDDLFRRNSVFHSKPEAFSPHYRSSLCYQPMSRAKLEAFLLERGFASGPRAFFSTGFLNQIYFTLDEIAFGSTGNGIQIPLASQPDQTIQFSSLPRKLAPTRTSMSETTWQSRLTTGTGDGTDEDDRMIRARRAFLFEEAFERPRPSFVAGQRWQAVAFLIRIRLKRGAKRWLGWTLNETDHTKRGEDEILLELTEGREGWQIPR